MVQFVIPDVKSTINNFMWFWPINRISFDLGNNSVFLTNHAIWYQIQIQVYHTPKDDFLIWLLGLLYFFCFSFTHKISFVYWLILHFLVVAFTDQIHIIYFILKLQLRLFQTFQSGWDRMTNGPDSFRLFRIVETCRWQGQDFFRLFNMVET